MLVDLEDARLEAFERAVTSFPEVMDCYLMTGDSDYLLRVLVRSATGGEVTQYTTFHCGPKRPGDADGPEEMHIVLVDNGRTRMIGDEFRQMLRCIRCGACMNHCVVYRQIGGHAYGGTYPGPMGAVLTPVLDGLAQSRDLPHACTMNGRCEEVCPVQIPLKTLLKAWRVLNQMQALLSLGHCPAP